MSIVTDILFVVLGFIIGILFIFIATNVNVNFNQEQPLSFFNLTERPSPYDRIKSEDITLEKDKIIIKVENPVLSSYAGTKSMDPTIDVNANGIEIKPATENDIHVGDIITFEKNNELIVHRVIEIGEDEQGWYCVTKGDNAPFSDGKIRFNEIKYITLILVW
ncbi:hypothetical protein CO154_02450 [Candidatus Pacearchaeota archaeon CG_4_9_14_3_um_filter_31_7]|nr:MAG: hypothetical protein AUJ10_01845 [Candidatus Pacearchaeota archaeon CG1_02_31_27]PIN92587.1 MAG: hypothetical protein COU55_00155 [Candidatus Pacearchaeota archaeon CG10_big_fil_rev_8_21_14_0_10_31_59]PIZ80729.1 MAG: hypothetical protein COX99_01850 [Candidatus Pacearchaeota archaeon CG_4_10_14_0_2_um_filter_31_10]PJA70521.1 MAG: hypothetical protein CO154_02450 [Candidatus Pacearchaeota archaeon CG_4_9_14_3_um_filter_31_7]